MQMIRSSCLLSFLHESCLWLPQLSLNTLLFAARIMQNNMYHSGRTYKLLFKRVDI